MIIDCHAHVFQHWAEACGHPSRHVHRKYMQRVQTRPAAKVFRARDGKRVDASELFRAGDNSWAGLTEVNFRVGRYGQLDFTVDGADYYVQYMPVAMQEIVAPPELMLSQMTYAGVDHCVLQAGGGYGAMNEYNAFAQQQYPAKFTGLLNVDEPRADTAEVLDQLARARDRLMLRGLYYGLEAFARYGFQAHFDDARYDVFWGEVERSGLPVFFEAPAIPDYDAASYTANMRRLDGLLGRFKRLRILLVMGPPVGFFGRDGEWQFPEDVAKLYGRDNVQLEVMFPITWGGTWEYPYPEAQALIRNLRDRFGAAKLIWGSDMPNVERFCTYTQSLDYVRRHCTFLNEGEKDLILGKNVQELCGIEAPAAERER